MEDKLLLLQIAFSIVADSSDYISMSIDNRIDEVRRVYVQLLELADGRVKVYERDTKAVQ
jgi:hypothetical protein